MDTPFLGALYLGRYSVAFCACLVAYAFAHLLVQNLQLFHTACTGLRRPAAHWPQNWQFWGAINTLVAVPGIVVIHPAVIDFIEVRVWLAVRVATSHRCWGGRTCSQGTGGSRGTCASPCSSISWLAPFGSHLHVQCVSECRRS